jgi:ribose transport system substrate-binding protein
MRKRQLLIAVPAISAALLLAGCGGSSSGGESSSAAATEAAASAAASTEASAAASPATSEAAAGDPVAAAKAAIDAAKAVPSTEDLGAPIDVKSLAGKTIYSIPIDSKLEFYQVGETAMKKIAEDAGLKYVTFPADGTPTSYQQGFAQAISAGAGAILLNGPLPETLAPQIADAKAAGIPVIPLHLSDSSEPALPDVPYEAFAPFNLGAKLATQYAIMEQDGQPVKALVIEASGTGPSAGMVQSIKDTLANEAPAGSEVVAEINSQVPQWSTEIQPAVQSALLKDPSINAVIPIYDSMALFAVPGITQAAADRNIGVYSFNGTPAVMKMIKDGIVRMDAAENPDWVSYVNLDTAFRAMLGADPIPGVSGPLRVIDETNVDETGTPPESGKGFGEDYPTAYKTMWGLG